MKSALLGVLVISSLALAAQASAAKPRTKEQRICDSFQAKVDLECAHLMCDDDIAQGAFKNLDECTSGEDYEEAAQEGCDSQPTTVEGLVKKYNKSHPSAKIKCKE